MQYELVNGIRQQVFALGLRAKVKKLKVFLRSSYASASELFASLSVQALRISLL